MTLLYTFSGSLSTKGLFQDFIVVAADVDDVVAVTVLLAVKGDGDRDVVLFPFDFFVALFDREVFHIGINRRHQAAVNRLGRRLVLGLEVVVKG